ncbi:MAG: hypothetical protein NTY04_02275 [Candidatus Staskawiczbacteria bacterium]|nr:hypothetical protein [Candidatus Staskawiczbacteria bacterium]
MERRKTEAEPEIEAEISPEGAVDSATSKVEEKESIDADESFGFVSKTKEWFSDKYKDISAGVENKYEKAKAWRAKEIRKPTKKGLLLAAKDIDKRAGRLVGDVIGVTPSIIFKIIKGLYKFGETIIKKKGKIGFGEGYDIGEEMFTFGEKKQKN